MSELFGEKAMLDRIKTRISSYHGSTLQDFSHDTFNKKYAWIPGKYDAITALLHFDEQDQLFEKTKYDSIFGAVQYVADYEKNVLGEVTPDDLSEPERLAGMVAYINGGLVSMQIIVDLEFKLGTKIDNEVIEQIKNF